MNSWKTPENYRNEHLCWHCNYDIRKQIGCTEKFFELGYYNRNTSRWDYYAEYQTLCKNCPHYMHDIGIYFGKGKYTDNIHLQDRICCLADVATEDDFEDLISAISPTVKSINFCYKVGIEKLTLLEELHCLECALFGSFPKNWRFWDFKKTPNLKVLEFLSTSHFTDLSELSNAKSLEYLGITTLTGRLDKLFYVDSFYPLTVLPNLKELSLECVMCSDGNIDNLINIPNLEKLWIAPHTFTNQDFAKFEALKFKIYDEYGIYQHGEYIRPLGKGGRCFRSEKTKMKYQMDYSELMKNYKTI